MKKVMFYCQHVLGMGHFMRSMALIRGLKEFQVCFLNGGEMIPGFEFPDSVEVVNLPPLKSDAAFKEIQGVDGQSLAEIQQARVRRLLAEFERFQPDVVIIELFPFGRKKFAFELIPLLARIRLKGSAVKVVCSLRDILISRPDQARYEAQVCALMNRYFDALFIHADPSFQRLEETFARVHELNVDIKYTGYVVQGTPDLAASVEDLTDFAKPVKNDEPLILVSIGGGRVGYELLVNAIEASDLIYAALPHRMLIFGGPYLPAEQFLQLQALAADKPHIILRQYTTHFLDFLRQADLSISMAGYNTCMDILSTGVRAMVWPFTGGDNNEQTLRADKLEQLGLVSVIRPDELQPLRLAEKIVQQLRTEPTPATLDMSGVKKTAAFLTNLLQEKNMSLSKSQRFPKTWSSQSQSFFVITQAHVISSDEGARNPQGTTCKSKVSGISPCGRNDMAEQLPFFKNLESELRASLERLQTGARRVHIFLRDDDIDEDEESLRHLLDISFSRGTPLNLEIIPGRLTPAAIKLLKAYKRYLPHLLELNQHGWQHHNHENEGRKCEFGISRTFDQQLADISQGKRLLEDIFGERFYPVFTPPWNRCAAATFAALDQLEFKVLSKDWDQQPVKGYRFQEISTTLDLFRWQGDPALKPPTEIIKTLIQQLDKLNPIGLLLHHKVMDDEAFSFLDWLLACLTQYSNVQFHTFQGLQQLLTPEIMASAHQGQELILTA
ncbi:MAG: hypothetical protein DPW09_19610 [Anaerolineae bacterium]|nr:hypothetical protein [Anaerolineales bacterium]MCQ3975649.1 hypothetical protein [Anaerolineae bacterium]